MENTTEWRDTDELKKVADELFSAIPSMGKALSVPTVQLAELTPDEFMGKWVSRNRPCLIKGGVKSWPLVRKWRDKQYWLSTCRNDRRNVYTHLNYFGWKRKSVDNQPMNFHEAIERLYQGQDHIFSLQMQEINEGNLFSGVIGDLPVFPFLPNPGKPLWDKARGVFIYRRSSTAWHVHNCDETLMCQINGAKTVALLPSDMPEAEKVTNFLESERYLEGESLDSNLDLKPRLVEVEEGDVLYIPPHWFHCVVPKDGQVGFTFVNVFRSPWHVYGNLSSFFVRRLYKMAFRSASLGVKLLIPVWWLYAVGSYQMRKIFKNRKTA